jgi:hypothetical protein
VQVLVGWSRKVVAIAVLGATLSAGAPLLQPTAALAAGPLLTRDYTVSHALGGWNQDDDLGPNRSFEVFSTPVVGDVRGDSTPEIIQGNNDGRLYEYTITGQFIGSWAVDPSPGMVVSSPALIDLDDDGKLDIVVGFFPSHDAQARATVVGFRGDSLKIFEKKTCQYPGKPCEVFATPAIGDVDGDGSDDIVVASTDHYVHAYRKNGSELPGWPRLMYDTTWSSVSLADMDKDGTAEVIVATDLDGPTCTGNPSLKPCDYGGYIRVLEADGSESARRFIHGEIPMSSPAVGDINGDGWPDIAIGSGVYFSTIPGRDPVPARRLYVFDRNLNPLPGWPVTLGGKTMASPALADLNNDGLMEVFTSAADGNVYGFRFDGVQIWKVCNRNPGITCGAEAPLSGSPVAADINNDGIQDIVAVTEHVLRVFDSRNGAVLFSELLWDGNRQTFAYAAAPTVTSFGGKARVFVHDLVDANKNGTRDAGDADGLISFSAPNDLGQSDWPMFRHDVRRGGAVTPLPPAPPIDQTPNGRYVAKAYRDLLGRSVLDNELRFWWTYLKSHSTADFARNLVFGDEWAHKVVRDLYLDVIDREPERGGWDYWVGRVREGMLVRDVAINMYAAIEYYNAKGGTPSSFVDALYADILHRAPDSGRQYWIDEVPRRGAASVVRDFYQGLESRQRRVVNLYCALLHRGTDPVGRDYWAGRLDVVDDLQLALELVVSNEYYSTPWTAPPASC